MTDKLAKIPEAAREYRVATRVLTVEVAQRFADILVSDLSHTVNSAALEAGVRPGTVRKAIHRYEHDQCGSLADEEICEIIVRAKSQHIKDIVGSGFICAARANKAGTSWAQWQAEVQAPLDFPRKQEATIELTGKGGGPIEASNAIRYVVHVPVDEPDDDRVQESEKEKA